MRTAQAGQVVTVNRPLRHDVESLTCLRVCVTQVKPEIHEKVHDLLRTSALAATAQATVVIEPVQEATTPPHGQATEGDPARLRAADGGSRPAARAVPRWRHMARPSWPTSLASIGAIQGFASHKRALPDTSETSLEHKRICKAMIKQDQRQPLVGTPTGQNSHELGEKPNCPATTEVPIPNWQKHQRHSDPAELPVTSPESGPETKGDTNTQTAPTPPEEEQEQVDVLLTLCQDPSTIEEFHLVIAAIHHGTDPEAPPIQGVTMSPWKPPRGGTAGQAATVAHKEHGIPQPTLITDLLGRVQLPRDPVRPQDALIAQAHGKSCEARCPCTAGGPATTATPPQVQHLPRLPALLAQGRWVATDEMNWYLNNLDLCPNAHPIKPAKMDDDLHAWFQQQWTGNCGETLYASAVLTNHHWEPWLLLTDGEVATLRTGPSTLARLQATPSIRALLDTNSLDVRIVQPLSFFQADCGFQAIAPEHHQTCTEATALGWRRQFLRSLIGTGRHHQKGTDYQLGGMAQSQGDTATLHQQLEELLHLHGVPAEQTRERATTVMQQLGRQPVQTALRSARPWADLKARANSCLPKLQLVLPAELEKIIQERGGKTVGNRTQKQKTVQPPPAHLSPHDLSIPPGVFKQVPETRLSQLQLDQIGQGCQGIVVVTAQQAIAYLRLATPITKEGLGMLILDHDHPSCAGLGQCIRFPPSAMQATSPSLPLQDSFN